MDLFSSQIASQCSDEEIDQMNDDEEFMRDILYCQKLQEMDYLQKHAEASLISGLKGNTHGYEWLLERVNPERYNKSIVKVEEANVGERPPTRVILVGADEVSNGE